MNTVTLFVVLLASTLGTLLVIAATLLCIYAELAKTKDFNREDKP